ncbi:MAG: MBL fold metallo-hydrolase [Planctomycetota bacterium]
MTARRAGRTGWREWIATSAAAVFSLALAGGCVTEEHQEEMRIRLDIDEGSIKVSVLGTAGLGGPERAVDALGLPRLPAALAVRSIQEGTLYLIDLSPSSLVQLESILDPGDPGLARIGPPVDHLFLTHLNPEVIPALTRLLFNTLPGQVLEVTATRSMLEAITSDPDLVRTGRIEQLHVNEAVDGEPLELGKTLRITPFHSPIDNERAFLGYRIEGSQRALVYLPACGSLESVRAAVIEQRYGPVRILLADGTRFDDREAPPAGFPPGCHPPMTEVLRLVDPGKPGGVHVLFTNLPARSPALDPNGRYQRLLLQAGARLESDGSEYWL